MKSKFRIVTVILVLLIILLYGILKIIKYAKHREFLVRIENEEKVLTVFWNDMELTENEFMEIYKDHDSPLLNKFVTDGDIAGCRAYSYGTVEEEMKYKFSLEGRRFKGMYNSTNVEALSFFPSDMYIGGVLDILISNYHLKKKYKRDLDNKTLVSPSGTVDTSRL